MTGIYIYRKTNYQGWLEKKHHTPSESRPLPREDWSISSPEWDCRGRDFLRGILLYMFFICWKKSAQNLALKMSPKKCFQPSLFHPHHPNPSHNFTQRRTTRGSECNLTETTRVKSFSNDWKRRAAQSCLRFFGQCIYCTYVHMYIQKQQPWWVFYYTSMKRVF